MVRMGVPALRVRVLAVRPSASIVALWMRTAKRIRAVTFKSFLRTLLHELCHNLDYELYRLPDSFHTEGFYKRESSLFRQLVRLGI
jgi:hypothetical protein